MVYRSNIVRAEDKDQNQYIIQFRDQYDEKGLLQKLEFTFVKVGNTKGHFFTHIYDFENLTLNNKPVNKFKKLDGIEEKVINKEDFKQEILQKFNQRIKLICPKEECNLEDCRPQINLGNKIFHDKNAKQPYFSSSCNGISYGESEIHLGSKIEIHKLLWRKALEAEKNNRSTKIKNIEIEKSFSMGNGQERRADVYYEKHYNNKNGELIVNKFAIEVQRSNINYENLSERTNWYKNNGIATFWIVVDEIFSNNEETIMALSKKNFGLPLLSLISFSMKKYNDRFYVYDRYKSKFLVLTVQQNNLKEFNLLEDSDKRNIKTEFSTNNLYLISTEKENDEHYKLLNYKSNRDNISIYHDILCFDCFNNSKDIMHKCWNEKNHKFEIVKFNKVH